MIPFPTLLLLFGFNPFPTRMSSSPLITLRQFIVMLRCGSSSVFFFMFSGLIGVFGSDGLRSEGEEMASI